MWLNQRDPIPVQYNGHTGYTYGIRRKGEYFMPKPTANVPYPVRHELMQDGLYDNGVSPEQLQTNFSGAPLPGNENRGQYTETPETLAKQRGSSSAPTTSKSSGTGGSLPSTGQMPGPSEMFDMMRR